MVLEPQVCQRERNQSYRTKTFEAQEIIDDEDPIRMKRHPHETPQTIFGIVFTHETLNCKLDNNPIFLTLTLFLRNIVSEPEAELLISLILLLN